MMSVLAQVAQTATQMESTTGVVELIAGVTLFALGSSTLVSALNTTIPLKMAVGALLAMLIGVVCVVLAIIN